MIRLPKNFPILNDRVSDVIILHSVPPGLVRTPSNEDYTLYRYDDEHYVNIMHNFQNYFYKMNGMYREGTKSNLIEILVYIKRVETKYILTKTPKGIQNQGNTCYANSLIQCLFLCKAFVIDVIACDYKIHKFNLPAITAVSTKSVIPVKSVKSVIPSKPVKSVIPAKSGRPIKPVKFVMPIKPVEADQQTTYRSLIKHLSSVFLNYMGETKGNNTTIHDLGGVCFGRTGRQQDPTDMFVMLYTAAGGNNERYIFENNFNIAYSQQTFFEGLKHDNYDGRYESTVWIYTENNTADICSKINAYFNEKNGVPEPIQIVTYEDILILINKNDIIANKDNFIRTVKACANYYDRMYNVMDKYRLDVKTNDVPKHKKILNLLKTDIITEKNITDEQIMTISRAFIENGISSDFPKFINKYNEIKDAQIRSELKKMITIFLRLFKFKFSLEKKDHSLIHILRSYTDHESAYIKEFGEKTYREIYPDLRKDLLKVEQTGLKHIEHNKIVQINDFLIAMVGLYDEKYNKKKVTCINVGPNITINIKTDNVERKITYSLIAFIEHLGNSRDSGHYVSYVKYDNKWYNMDDSTVTVIGPDIGGLTANAYVLFYKKIE